jgi:homocitrate synthase NifV
VRIADTVGIASPRALGELFQRLMEAQPGVDLEFHGHDDLGLATANSLAAVEGGAAAVSVTVNGLGERAGNAPLEEVAVALKLLQSIDTGVDFRKLPLLCRRVAELSRRPLPPSKAIVGRDVFTHESGVHVNALLQDEHAFQPFLPQELGEPPARFVIGKHSGSSAIRHVLRQRGIEIEDAQSRSLIPHVRRAAETAKRELSPEELEKLYRMHVASAPTLIK